MLIFSDIMKRYDLLEHFEDVEDAKAWKKPKPFKDDSKNYIVKDVFRDKRLNKLWAKAERGGFNRAYYAFQESTRLIQRLTIPNNCCIFQARS